MLKQTASAIASFSVPLESVGKTVSMLLFIADNGGTLDGGKNTSLFKAVDLILLPVNKPPHFSLASHSIVVSESASQDAQVFRSFVLDISAGQPAEKSQMLQFICDTMNPFLFEIQPSISFLLHGTLTLFKTALNSFGESNVSLSLYEVGEPESKYSSYFVIHVNRSYDPQPSCLFRAPGLFSMRDLQI